MKYKTLFRLAVKLTGVVFSILGIISFASAMFQLFFLSDFSSPVRSLLHFNSGALGYLVTPAITLALGAYLLFDGEWIVNKAIPSNKPYCHECGYLLKDLTGDRCPECDTPFRPERSPEP